MDLGEKRGDEKRAKGLGVVDLDRADGLEPNDAWTFKQRRAMKRKLKDLEGSLVDLDRVDGL